VRMESNISFPLESVVISCTIKMHCIFTKPKVVMEKMTSFRGCDSPLERIVHLHS
jgi:hypothetical protein